MDLETALQQFDATEANLRRIEVVWSELDSLIPDGIAFIEGTPEGRRYQELTLAYDDLVRALPAISGYRVTATPMSLNAIATTRFDLAELAEFSADIQFDESLAEPGKQLTEYRFRFEKARRALVRESIAQLAGRVRTHLVDLTTRFPPDDRVVSGPELDALRLAVSEIERLAGGQIPRTKAWGDLQRHLRFAQGLDLHDISQLDWPVVDAELQRNLYSELEPVPVAVGDLTDVVHSRPTGAVTTAVAWSDVTDEDFERFLFNLIADAHDYDNPQWLTATRAPDRGRDLSAEHVMRDSLNGSVRQRVVFQARHWLRRAVRWTTWPPCWLM